MLAPYIGGALLGEGVPTWFGGLRGRSTASLYQLVVEYQDANPKTTLAQIIYRTPQDDIRTDDVLRATGALFVEHVYRRAGIAGLRALKGMPNEPSAVLAAMGRHLPLSTDSSALERWWRDAARAAVRRR